jgi:alkylated DNA repair dioxygenase AlkB/ubiquinone/menaquinone biosynthesis C-methylase UbiE
MIGESETANSFRSLLPHEPLPEDETKGYLHIQGALEGKKAKNLQNAVDDLIMPKFVWTSSSLHVAFLKSDEVKKLNGFESVEILDQQAPFAKIRMIFSSPIDAYAAMVDWRRRDISAHDIFTDLRREGFISFSTRPLQVTQITKIAMLPIELAWTRSNPPKFRKLIRTTNSDHAETLDDERLCTRFVVITNLEGKKEYTEDSESDINYVMDDMIQIIREFAHPYDSTGKGVEVFVPHKCTKLSTCHVGMRLPEDAQRLIRDRQGTHLTWTRNIMHSRRSTGKITKTWRSQPLLLDYATITPQSSARSLRTDGREVERGLPSRSECTSTTDSTQVPGLYLIPDFLTLEQEEVLMAVLHGPQAPWAPFQNNPSLTGSVKRRVQHYGYVFDYETADVLRDRTPPIAACPPLPSVSVEHTTDSKKLEEFLQIQVKEGSGWDVLAAIIEKVRMRTFDGGEKFDQVNQVTVNEYRPGEGIGSHIDTPLAFGDGIMSLSLNSGIVMEFWNSKSNEKKLLYLPARSLVVMTGQARYEWQHHIVTRRTDTHNGLVIPRRLRVSLTLRTALNLPKEGGAPLLRIESNSFPPVWGVQQKTHINVLKIPETERQHVHAVYDAVATQWHHTRGKRGVLWPGATTFVQNLPKGSIVADIGCGDGKYFPAIWEAGSYVIGTDISLPLLKTCNLETVCTENRKVSPHRSQLRRRPALAVADCLMLPIKDNSVDAALCIAVLHHLSTEDRRLQCLRELARIVKPGGLINVQAWAMEQTEGSRRKFASTDVFVPFNAQPKYLEKLTGNVSIARSEEANNCISVAQLYAESYDGAEYDERKGLVVFQRYCHLYREGELEFLASKVEGLILVESGYESGNYYVIVRTHVC